MGKYVVKHICNEAKAICDLCGETKYTGCFSVNGEVVTGEFRICRDCIERLAICIKRDKSLPIRFNMETMKWEGLKLSEVRAWEKQFDCVDVSVEFVKIRGWILRKKETKQVQKRNWRVFIINWLRREQAKQASSVN